MRVDSRLDAKDVCLAISSMVGTSAFATAPMVPGAVADDTPMVIIFGAAMAVVAEVCNHNADQSARCAHEAAHKVHGIRELLHLDGTDGPVEVV